MSYFCRGCTTKLPPHSLRLPSTIRAAVFTVRPQSSRLRASFRCFSQSVCQRAQPIRHTVNRAVPTRFVSDPVLRTVTETGKPILLYHAPIRLWYTLMVYGFVCGCTGGGLWIFNFASELPKELPFFVKPTYWVVALMVLGTGAYAFTAPIMRASSLELLPALRGGTLKVRVRARVAPMLKEKVIFANLGEVTMSEKTVPLVRELKEAERARRQDVSEGLGDMFIIRRGWNITARLLDQKWTSFFLYFKFAVLRFGVTEISINGEKWKLDCSEYLLEDGQAIDRFISVDEDL